MTDELKTRVETDEYIYEEYFEATQGIDQQPTPSMTAWNRSMRSLFHLQNALQDTQVLWRVQPTQLPADCIRQECYQRGEINTCECSFCQPKEEEI